MNSEESQKETIKHSDHSPLLVPNHFSINRASHDLTENPLMELDLKRKNSQNEDPKNLSDYVSNFT